MAASAREERSRAKGNASEEPPRSLPFFRSPELQGQEQLVRQRAAAAQAPGNVISWRGLLGKLWMVQRLQVFDTPQTPPLDYASLLRPGGVTVIDLSDTDAPQVNNLVIADLLRGVQKQQEASVRQAEAAQRQPTPVVIIIEEAHEFLSAQRISQMPVQEQITRFPQLPRLRPHCSDGRAQRIDLWRQDVARAARHPSHRPYSCACWGHALRRSADIV
jgi:hypothetical protein